jgi:hypothetical protein
VFEHGLGAADKYGTKPSDVFDLLVKECGLKLSTLKGFIKEEAPLSGKEFDVQFYEKINYYFIAHS